MDITRQFGSLVAVALGLAACGGSSSDTAATTATTAAAAVPADSTEPVATEQPVTEPPATEAPATTSAPTTTMAPAPEPFDLSSLPALVAAADAAATDATIDPFSVVDDIVGLPLPIPVPEGSTLYQFDVDRYQIPEDDIVGWSTRYDVIAPGGVVDDIDLDLDGNGPGSQQVIDLFDPIMSDLGFERKNSTASDPGDSGGPSSVNHVYVALDPAIDVHGTEVLLDPVFIWSSEDINGWAYRDTRPELAGYSVDVGFETAQDDTIPFPLAEALLEAFPLPDGVELNDVMMSMRNRDADAFSIDDGATYIEVVFAWDAPADALDEVTAFYADPTSVFIDEAVFMAGEDDFFDDGTIARTEPYVYDTTGLRLDVLLLQQYGGLFGIDASEDGVEPVELQLSITLNPNDTPLEFPAD